MKMLITIKMDNGELKDIAYKNVYSFDQNQYHTVIYFTRGSEDLTATFETEHVTSVLIY